MSEIERLEIIRNEILSLKNPEGGDLRAGLMKYLWIDKCAEIVDKHMKNAIKEKNEETSTDI